MRKDSGFTLIELMIVIAMIGILVAIAVPNIIGWLPNYRLKAAARDLVSNSQKAKLEAVKRNTDVVISFTPGAYTPSGQVGSYQIFVDNAPNNGTFDIGEPILAQVTMPRNASLYNTTFAGDVTSFSARGLPAASGNVDMQNSNSRYYRCSLSPAGSIRLQMSSDGVTWN